MLIKMPLHRHRHYIYHSRVVFKYFIDIRFDGHADALKDSAYRYAFIDDAASHYSAMTFD